MGQGLKLIAPGAEFSRLFFSIIQDWVHGAIAREEFGFKVPLVETQGLHRTGACFPLDVMDEVISKASITDSPIGDEW
jgi:hypothetical protein